MNGPIEKDELQSIMYGHGLLCLIGYIVACCKLIPKSRMLLSKFELKSTYRRWHMIHDTVI